MSYTDEHIERRIREVFSRTVGTYRTVGGLSRETSIPEETIRDFIQRHPNKFRKPRSGLFIPTGGTGSYSYIPSEELAKFNS